MWKRYEQNQYIQSILTWAPHVHPGVNFSNTFHSLILNQKKKKKKIFELYCGDLKTSAWILHNLLQSLNTYSLIYSYHSFLTS